MTKYTFDKRPEDRCKDEKKNDCKPCKSKKDKKHHDKPCGKKSYGPGRGPRPAPCDKPRCDSPKKVCLIKKREGECKRPNVNVQKNLLNISTASEGLGPNNLPAAYDPDRHIVASALSITYEVIIENDTCNDLRNLSVSDNLGGFATEIFDQNDAVVASVRVIRVSGTLEASSPEEQQCGNLLDSCKSYVKSCSTAVIVVRLDIFPVNGNAAVFCDITNTVVVEGALEHCTDLNECQCCCKIERFTSIVAKSSLIEHNPDLRDCVIHLVGSVEPL